MARSLNEIMTEINARYDPQRALVAQQQAALPDQQQGDIAGLEAAKTNAFGDITNQANSRGVVYSGAPIAEQQRYVGEKYLPALAGIKNDYANQGFKLQAALLGINQNQGQEAQGIRNDELTREMQAAQAAQDRQDKLAAAQQQQLQLQAMAPKPAPQVDLISAARGLAKTRKDQLLAAGNVQPYAREAVIKELVNMGLAPAQASQIVYKEVFPDNWAGSYNFGGGGSQAASAIGKQFGFGS